MNKLSRWMNIKLQPDSLLTGWPHFPCSRVYTCCCASHHNPQDLCILIALLKIYAFSFLPLWGNIFLSCLTHTEGTCVSLQVKAKTISVSGSLPIYPSLWGHECVWLWVCMGICSSGGFGLFLMYSAPGVRTLYYDASLTEPTTTLVATSQIATTIVCCSTIPLIFTDVMQHVEGQNH